MTKVVILLVAICLLLGCQHKTVAATIEIPKDVAIAQELTKQVMYQEKSQEMGTKGIETALVVPIVNKVLEEFIKYKNRDKDKLIYKIVIYDTRTIDGNYKLTMPGQTIEFSVKNDTIKENCNEGR